MRRNCSNSFCSFTELAVGLTDEGCCAAAGGVSPTSAAKAKYATTSRRRARSLITFFLPFLVHLSPRTRRQREGTRWLHRDLLAIRRLPAPGAGAVAALHHPLLVDLGDDLAVSRQERFGRAHLGAQRQLAFG